VGGFCCHLNEKFKSGAKVRDFGERHIDNSFVIKQIGSNRRRHKRVPGTYIKMV
jgi:hypothetical protein